MDEVIQEVAIDQVELDPLQPRKDLGDLEGLKRSIQRYGILQPPVVTPAGPDHYRLLAGERRVTAARELGLSHLTVIIRTVDDHERRYLQLVENLQREDLDPFEQADTFRQLMEEFHISEEELGARVGKSQDHVSRALTIGENIPEEIRQEFYATSRKVSPSVLLEIARANGLAKQRRMWEHASANSYTVRQARSERRSDDDRSPVTQEDQPSRRQVIRLDNAKVTIQSEGSGSMEEIHAILREATKCWEQRMELYRFRTQTNHRETRTEQVSRTRGKGALPGEQSASLESGGMEGDNSMTPRRKIHGDSD